MFGVAVSNEFLQNEEHLKQLGQIAEGDISSFDALRNAAMIDYVTHLDVIGPDQETIDGIRNELLNMVTDIQSQSNIEIGTSLDTKYIDQLNEMLRNGQITEQQMNQILGGIGYHPNVRYKTVMGPETKTHHKVQANLFGNNVTLAEFDDITSSEVQVPEIEGGSGDTTGTAPTYVGKPSSSKLNLSSSNSGPSTTSYPIDINTSSKSSITFSKIFGAPIGISVAGKVISTLSSANFLFSSSSSNLAFLESIASVRDCFKPFKSIPKSLFSSGDNSFI